jgi:hypothetical protein
MAEAGAAGGPSPALENDQASTVNLSEQLAAQ